MLPGEEGAVLMPWSRDHRELLYVRNEAAVTMTQGLPSFLISICAYWNDQHALAHNSTECGVPLLVSVVGCWCILLRLDFYEVLRYGGGASCKSTVLCWGSPAQPAWLAASLHFYRAACLIRLICV